MNRNQMQFISRKTILMRN